MQSPQITKIQVEKKVTDLQAASASLLLEMQVQTQEQLEQEIAKIVPDEVSKEVAEELTYGGFNWADPLRWM